MKKRTLTLLLVLALILLLVPAVFAADEEPAAEAVEAANMPPAAEENQAFISGEASADQPLDAPPADELQENITVGDWTYNVSNGVATIAKYNGTAANVTLPTKATINGSSYKLKTLEAGAFQDNYTLKSVTIPAEYTSIGRCAFKNCTNLSSVTINGDLADQSESSTHPNSYSQKSHDYSVFYNTGTNSDGMTITFGEGVTYVPACLFATGYPKTDDDYCHVTKVVISSTVTNIRTYAFYHCYDLKTVQFSANGKLSDIGNYAFSACTSITTLSLPSSLRYIGGWAFLDCTGMTQFTAPNGLISIGPGAIQNCYSLVKVTISKTVKSLGECVFKNCTNLSSVTINGDLADLSESSTHSNSYSQKSHDYSVFYNTGTNSGGMTITFGEGATCVPACLFATGYPIEDDDYCHVTKVVFSSTVTSIRAYAFYHCYDLKTVQFSANGKLSDIGNYAFSACTSITTLSLPTSLRNIGGWTFLDCTGLTQFTAPDGLASIGPGAIQNCYSLEKVTLSKTVKSLGECVFKNCTNLSSVTINGEPADASESSTHSNSYSQKSHDYSVFYNTGINTNGMTITFGEGVTRIPACLFATGYPIEDNDYCHVRIVNLPSTLTVIGNYAFYHCYDLATVNYNGTKTTFDAINVGTGNDSLTGASFTYATTPKITTQPQNTTVKIGGTATFKVVASGSFLTYQWQYKKVGETSWTDWAGKTSASVSCTAGYANNGCKYRCVVKNGAGSVTSNTATLTVLTPPVITKQPVDAIAVVSETAVFTVTVSGATPMTYQWQQLKVGETKWTNADNATSASLSVTAYTNRGGRQYRCVITNSLGSVTSEPATLLVRLHSGCPCAFIDMPAYGTVEHDAIDWAYSSNPQITNGTTDTTFSPNKTITRGQAVTFLWRACGCPEPKSTTNPFTDVKESSYCYKAVLWANEKNITNGTTATTFSPNKTCTRGQILTFLYRQQGSPSVGTVTVPYTDVKAGAYYENAMKWAYKKGIDRGVSTTKFAPNADCTRVSTVVFLYRAITGKGRLS